MLECTDYMLADYTEHDSHYLRNIIYSGCNYFVLLEELYCNALFCCCCVLHRGLLSAAPSHHKDEQLCC